ncbi:hypothetical protein [Pedobacter nyackensis]|uniref:hypothetical protein n=1 Tax=Pedobacter nyackensis TaxID=475255 RepID=UPI00292E4C14|nr:hypothetical protein [Pedobacter nyackensis]
MNRYLRFLMLMCLTTVFSSAGKAQQNDGKLTNLGVQVGAAMIQGSTFLTDSKGKELVFTVVRGEPAHLLGYEVKSGQLILDKELEGADGAWDMAYSSDGYLYIPGASGFLFRHRPGTQIVENLGMALKGETYVWNLTVGKEGEIFGATYPGCRVFRYHPKDGFSDVGKGPLVVGENYVRSLAFHKETGLLYAGIGSHAHLIEIDPVSGIKKDILPEKYKSMEFVYGLEQVRGKDGVDRLFVLLTSGRKTLVYNLQTRQVEQEIEDMDMKMVYSDRVNGKVFYTSKSNLMSFDPSGSVQLAKALVFDMGTANAIAMGRDKKIYILTATGTLVKYNPENGKAERKKLNIPQQPIPINAILYGPDEKIWMGGYLAGGHATYDPATGKNVRYSGLDQTEGMAVQGNSIYFGIYPKGRFYVYNTEGKWNPDSNNPRKIGEIEGQSRSFAALSLDKEQKMVFGMIPEYGKLGGALVVYNKTSDQLTSFGEVIPLHAIASLVESEGLVLAGTTISGGLGVKPTAKEAVLFGWNTTTNTKEFELVPVPGAAAITCMINGPDGHVWGIAGGMLFIFDTEKRAVISTHKLYDVPPLTSHVWRGGALVVHPSGEVYGTGNDHLFKIDPKTKTLTMLVKGASLLAMDKDGNLYFRRTKELWRYTVNKEGK